MKSLNKVVDEIRNLTEQTLNSVRKIDSIIKDVQIEVQNAFSEMEKDKDVTKKQDYAFIETIDTFVNNNK